MTSQRPALVVFQGGALSGAPGLAKLVADAQAASTLDLLDTAARNGAFSQAFLATEQEELADVAASQAGDWAGELPLTILPGGARDGKAFHFGEALHNICEAHGLVRVVYVGGGAMPLGTEVDVRSLAVAVGGESECVVANNLYSADVVAFQPASALRSISLPATDNDLAWLLHYRAGLPFAPIPRTLATQFDLDTPTDLATLWRSCLAGDRGSGIRDQGSGISSDSRSLIPDPRSPLFAIGPHLAEMLEGMPGELPFLVGNVERAYEVMATRRAEIMVAGRVSSWVWRRLEVNLPCQTRIISEERGMRASGREDRGEARSLLGLYSDVAGVPGLIKAIEQTCDAAFIDTRVLFAHRNLKPSAQDRFASDAFMPELIADPWIRELTEAAMASSVPIVFGGHSLVSGGVWALSERVRGSASAGC